MTRRIPHITESSAFPPSIVGVQTAVPAFIGYTEKAEMEGKPAFFRPLRIDSLADYEAVFGGFKPLCRIVPAELPAMADFKVFDAETDEWHSYRLEPETGAPFILYNSLRLFYANGGGSAYVVSVGSYAKSGTVKADDLLNGLATIKEQVGPTMLVVPDAVRLGSADDYQKIVRAMLAQCGELTDRVAILDVYGGDAVSDPASLNAVTQRFHEAVGDLSLSYAMAYFPFVKSTAVGPADYDYMNLDLNDAATLENLKAILSWENRNLYPEASLYDGVQANINQIGPDNTPAGAAALNQALTAALPLLAQIEQLMLDRNNVLPPSGAMAGIYTMVDATRGVWNAPANIALNDVSDLTYRLDDSQQGELNIPLDGKAINAIRQLTGRGNVVWGARTLDGNSNDYRYIQVRRTLIYIEQSIKNALNQFVFAPNDGTTWVAVVASVSNFLQGVWSQGGLMGATASEAFTVECGLGSTMTGQDILEGYMIVQVTLQMIRPAEFIELTFKQKMEGVS